MDNETGIVLDHVSKKFCKSLKRSMRYGMRDISRNILGLGSHPGTLRRDEFWAVNDVSFEVGEGETLGLIGPNGGGKSTVLKMVNGIFWPDKGKITVRGNVGALIEVGAGFHPALTGRENIYVNAAILGMTKSEVTEKFDSIVQFAEIGDFLDTPVKYYSSGMFVRLGFAVAVHCEPEILLVDEVLAVGDEGFQLKCFNKIGQLKKNGTTVVLVSHNMHTIAAFAEEVVLLNNGKATHFERVGDGIDAYSDLFQDGDGFKLEKIASGNEHIQFYDVTTNKVIFQPGDTFSMSLKYASARTYHDVEIDLKIYSSEDARKTYFQATNRVFNETIDLNKGKHELKTAVQNIPLNTATAKISVAIWSQSRKDLLFWWRIPVKFEGIGDSTGQNFLKVTYATA